MDKKYGLSLSESVAMISAKENLSPVMIPQVLGKTTDDVIEEQLRVEFSHELNSIEQLRAMEIILTQAQEWWIANHFQPWEATG